MPAASLGLRLIFKFYACVCLAAGGLVLTILLGLRLTNLLLDWSAPFDPADWTVFGAGLIVVVMLLGPYLATIGQLTGVQRVRASIHNETPLSSSRRWLMRGLLLGICLFFLSFLLLSHSLIIWITFGTLPVLMGLALFYIAWRIGRIERLSGLTIYQTDYKWRFDRTSYIGVRK